MRRELDLPTQFPLAAQREADEAAARVLARLTAAPATGPNVADRTDIEFVTIDPAASRDFDGPPLDDPGHGAVAAPYAHVTAPLRLLADRYPTEVCLSLSEGHDVPDWAR